MRPWLGLTALSLLVFLLLGDAAVTSASGLESGGTTTVALPTVKQQQKRSRATSVAVDWIERLAVALCLRLPRFHEHPALCGSVEGSFSTANNMQTVSENVHSHDGMPSHGSARSLASTRSYGSMMSLGSVRSHNSMLSLVNETTSTASSSRENSEQRAIRRIRKRAAVDGWHRACRMFVHFVHTPHASYPMLRAVFDAIPTSVVTACEAIIRSEVDTARVSAMDMHVGHAVVWAAGRKIAYSQHGAMSAALATVDERLTALTIVLPREVFDKDVIDATLAVAARQPFSDNLRAVYRRIVDSPVLDIGRRERARLDALALHVARKYQAQAGLRFVLEERVFLGVARGSQVKTLQSHWSPARRRRKVVEEVAASATTTQSSYHTDVLLAAIENEYLGALKVLIDVSDAHASQHEAKFTVDDIGAALVLAARIGSPGILKVILTEIVTMGTRQVSETGPPNSQYLDPIVGDFLDTALSMAAMHGHTACMRHLLRAGADVEKAGGEQLLGVALSKDRRFTARLLERALTGKRTKNARHVRFATHNRVRYFTNDVGALDGTEDDSDLDTSDTRCFTWDFPERASGRATVQPTSRSTSATAWCRMLHVDGSGTDLSVREVRTVQLGAPTVHARSRTRRTQSPLPVRAELVA